MSIRSRGWSLLAGLAPAGLVVGLVGIPLVSSFVDPVAALRAQGTEELVAVEGEHCRILAPHTLGDRLAPALAAAEKAWIAALELYGAKAKPGVRADVVLIPDAWEYHLRLEGAELAHLEGAVAGFIDLDRREAVVFVDKRLLGFSALDGTLPPDELGTIRHEAVHLAALLCVPEYERLPRWADEGVAKWVSWATGPEGEAPGYSVSAAYSGLCQGEEADDVGRFVQMLRDAEAWLPHRGYYQDACGLWIGWLLEHGHPDLLRNLLRHEISPDAEADPFSRLERVLGDSVLQKLLETFVADLCQGPPRWRPLVGRLSRFGDGFLQRPTDSLAASHMNVSWDAQAIAPTPIASGGFRLSGRSICVPADAKRHLVVGFVENATDGGAQRLLIAFGGTSSVKVYQQESGDDLIRDATLSLLHRAPSVPAPENASLSFVLTARPGELVLELSGHEALRIKVDRAWRGTRWGLGVDRHAVAHWADLEVSDI